MTNWFKLTVAISVVLFQTILPHNAQAQIPSNFVGIWAVDGCENGEPAVITSSNIAGITDGVLIVFEDSEINSYALRSKDMGDGWFEVTMKDGSRPLFFKRDGDQLLRERMLPTPPNPAPENLIPENLAPQTPNTEAPTTEAPATEPQTTEPPVTENLDKEAPSSGENAATNCSTAPARWQVPHGEVIGFLLRQQDLSTSCDGSDAAQCLGALMDEFDITGDGALGTAEISRAARVMVQFGALMDLDDGESEIKEGELLATSAAASAVGTIVAKALLVSLDYDESGTLSVDELARDRRFQARTPYDPQNLLEFRDVLEDGIEGVGDFIADFFDDIGDRS
jgi:hypothetical protein